MGLLATREELHKLGFDLMGRMDRLQEQMTGFDQHLTMGLGHTDEVETQFRALADSSRLQGDQLRTLHKLLRLLEGRVNGLEDRLS
jgi:hypothetical protein